MKKMKKTVYEDWSKEQLIEKLINYDKEIKKIKQKKRYFHKQRPFDITKYSQRPIALKISYLGWNYYGYAAQENENVETIESHLFNALTTAKLIKDRSSCKYNRCGRTDKGVSAFSQIINLCVRSNLEADHKNIFTWQELMENDENKDGEKKAENEIINPDQNPDRDSSKKMSIEKDNNEKDNKNINISNQENNNNSNSNNNNGNNNNNNNKRKHKNEENSKNKNLKEIPYVTILNRLLPQDIRVISWSPVPIDFDARFYCTYRTYKYFFPKQNLDIERMQMAAKKFIGAHDFRNFCKVDPLYNSHYIRTVYESRIYKIDDLSHTINSPNERIEPKKKYIDDPEMTNDIKKSSTTSENIIKVNELNLEKSISHSIANDKTNEKNINIMVNK